MSINQVNVRKLKATERLYDYLCDRPYGYPLPYREIEGIIEMDPQQRPGRGVVIRVRKRLLDDRQKWLENVWSVGYRIVTPAEHAEAAKQVSNAAGRRLQRAHDITVHVDYDQLTATERAVHIDIQVRINLSRLFHEGMHQAKALPPSTRQLRELFDPQTFIKRLFG
jgi:hypothetical protein